MLVVRVHRSGSFLDDAGRARSGAARAVAIGTRVLEGMVAMRAPVDTGFLRNSVQSTVTGTTGVVTVGAEYGAYVEYGTRRMSAQPYFHPAIEQFRPIYRGIVEREVSR